MHTHTHLKLFKYALKYALYYNCFYYTQINLSKIKKKTEHINKLSNFDLINVKLHCFLNIF